MNNRDRLIEFVSKRDRIFEIWRQAPMVDQLVSKLETENSNVRGLEALLRFAFEAGWVEGFNHANE